MIKPSNSASTFILVGADKGGVGKTTVCRVLLDYIARTSATVRMFDTEPFGGVLKRFFPKAQTIDLTSPTDQALVVDGLAAARVTVVDVRAGLLSPTLHLFQRIGLNHGGETHLAVLHVLGNSIASLGEIKNTATLLATGGDHILVKNHANGGGFFEWDAATQNEYLAAVNPKALVEIGNLEAAAAERADKSDQPFATFGTDVANSRTMRGLVRAWEADAFAEFDRVGLKNIIS
jgi:hypothetical protein